MVDFIIENKELFFVILGVLGFLVEGILSIIGFIVILNKKLQPDVRAFILQNLPELISDAEEYFKLSDWSLPAPLGSSRSLEKKRYVIEQMCSLLENRFPSIKTSYFYSFISKSIEDILGTPQKKEVVK